jgi:hypothetical protein
MEAIQSLFIDKTEIEINHQNEKFSPVLTDTFNNIILRRALSSYDQHKIQLYSLNFEILSLVSKKLLNTSNLIENNIRFPTNLFIFRFHFEGFSSASFHFSI